MADQRIQYTEEMVGAGHPTKADTLNRLALIEADIDGKGLYRYFKEQASEPTPESGEGVLFCQDDGSGTPALYWKPFGGDARRLGLGETLRRGMAVIVHSGTGTKITNVDLSSLGLDTTQTVEVLTGVACNAAAYFSGGLYRSGNNLVIETGVQGACTVYVGYEVQRCVAKVQKLVPMLTIGTGTNTPLTGISDAAFARVISNGIYNITTAGYHAGVAHQITAANNLYSFVATLTSTVNVPCPVQIVHT